MTCRCAHGDVENVAACNAAARCCGPARVVCQHYCTGKHGTWTGKIAQPSSADDRRLRDGLDDLYDAAD
jgi:hypothetical protein